MHELFILTIGWSKKQRKKNDEARLNEMQEVVEEPVLSLPSTQNAEFMMLGHVGLNALQSNHSW
jgi:hypothetical protein